MSQFLAIEWDATEARIAVARTRGKDATIEHAFAVPLGGRDTADTNVGQKIAAALRTRHIGRLETLVAVGRASIEFRQLSLPQSPPEEMPDMVRFQALRQFTSIGEDWPIDFVLLETNNPDAASVLAAAIAPDLVGQIKNTCRAAELTPNRLVLRPFAAASLLRRTDGGVAQPYRLMVDLLTEEADLTVLDDRNVQLMRTVRLPSGDDIEVQSKSLIGEIRRTIAAATNQLHGRRVEKIILCGAGQDQAALKASIEQELSLPVDLFNPFDKVALGPNLKATRPEHAGRFAPLIGMLLDEVGGATHAIDFLHPKKKPEPVNARRRNLLISATVAAAALAVVLLIMIQLESLDSDIIQLRSQIAGMKGKVAAAEKQKQNTAAVQEFVDSDIHWLDELSTLSQRLPPAEDVLITQLNAGTRMPSGGEINVDGFTRSSEQIKDIQQRLRTEGRKVISKGGQDDPRRSKEKLRWRFDETVILQPGVQANASTPSAAPTATSPTAAAPRSANQSSGSSPK